MIRQTIKTGSSPRRSRFSRIALSLAVALALFLPNLQMPSRPAAATTSDLLAQAKKNVQNVQARQAKLAAENKQLEAKTTKLGGELAWLNERSQEQRDLYTERSAQLEAALEEQRLTWQSYLDSEQTLADKQKQYIERVSVMADYRGKSLFRVFLEANSLQGFFTTIEFMNLVAEQDQIALEELRTARDDAHVKRDLALQHSEDMEAIVAQVEADLARLEADTDAKKTDLSANQLQLSRQETQEDQLNQEAADLAKKIGNLQVQLEKEITATKAAEASRAAAASRAAEASRAAAATKAAQATLAAKRAAEAAAAKAANEAEKARLLAQQQAEQKTTAKPTPAPTQKPPVAAARNSNGWVWPVPSTHSVSSYFGMRLHPVYRYYRMHTGIDIGGSFGSSIVAAADGIVMLVSNPVEGRNYGGYGYGNYVVIAHSGGLSTLYGHLKNTLVRTGQSVRAGDRIATCGSTGTSTGSHLHFEVIKNGVQVNPLNYVS